MCDYSKQNLATCKNQLYYKAVELILSLGNIQVAYIWPTTLSTLHFLTTHIQCDVTHIVHMVDVCSTVQ